jgi:hypothetical protein
MISDDLRRLLDHHDVAPEAREVLSRCHLTSVRLLGSVKIEKCFHRAIVVRIAWQCPEEDVIGR